MTLFFRTTDVRRERLPLMGRMMHRVGVDQGMYDLMVKDLMDGVREWNR